MKVIIDFFRWLWNGIVSSVTWFLGVPAIITSSVAGVYAALSATYNEFTSADTFISNVVSSSVPLAVSLCNAFNNAPDIIQLAAYCCSLDVLFSFITSFATLLVALVFAVLTAHLITFPALVASWYLVKVSAWFIAAVVPSSYLPNALKGYSGIGHNDTRLLPNDDVIDV